MRTYYCFCITYFLYTYAVTYCWEDINISELEGTGQLTAVLKRTGHTLAGSTAGTGSCLFIKISDFMMNTAQDVYSQF